MTLEAPMRCSALAEHLAEPMIGSVDQRTRWLLLEDRSAWGSHAVDDLFGVAASAAAKALRLRLLLVRRREGDPADDAVRHAMLVDTVTRETAAWTVGGPAEIDVEEVAHRPVGAFGPPMADGPLFLICTNGKRDACCALRGRALMASMAPDHGARTWECTHLGGHRFAGNLVCLPDGIVYGRVLPADGPRLADTYVAGRLDASLLRGRSAWPPPAQVAERELRLRTGIDGVDAVRAESSEVDGERATVSLATPDGRTHRFALIAERLSPPRATSCRADEVDEPLHWKLAAT